MAVIAIHSAKGGVGKTTLAANLAWCAATISCRRTLLWDLDPAGGAGFLFEIEAKAGKDAGAVFDKSRDPAKLIRRTAYPRLDLLPADESIRALDSQLATIGKRKRLAKLTAGLGKDYDRIVLDCPPVLGELAAQVIRAADLVIVPLPPSPLSVRALDHARAAIGAEEGHAPTLLPVITMLDRRRALHRDFAAANPDWPVIPLASTVEQCAVRRQPVGAFAPRSAAGRAFAELWAAIERRLAERR